MASRTGSCACGAVTYRLTSAPLFVHCCHCLLCQKQTGSAFAINALIEASRVRVTKGKAKLEAIAMPTLSEYPHDIYRCRECKVALWSDYARRKVMLFVRVATLDEPHAIQPDVHIFTRSKVPWVKLPKSARAFEVYYDRHKEWPKASLARREKLLGQGR
ncbi:MAG: GFA family protein [Deltaproteobacteria bacterium]|nr:GFA family protein [Deltaproteobacteria bacterium]